VYSRRDVQWLHEWIKNSSKMIANGDPAAVELFNANKKLVMTNFSSMSKEDLDAVIAYLKYVAENKDSDFD
jgi:cytochrome c1